jgi:hypothetical protein
LFTSALLFVPFEVGISTYGRGDMDRQPNFLVLYALKHAQALGKGRRIVDDAPVDLYPRVAEKRFGAIADGKLPRDSEAPEQPSGHRRAL